MLIFFIKLQLDYGWYFKEGGFYGKKKKEKGDENK
jgi:hypothetical protein